MFLLFNLIETKFSHETWIEHYHLDLSLYLFNNLFFNSPIYSINILSIINTVWILDIELPCDLCIYIKCIYLCIVVYNIIPTYLKYI